MLLLPLALGLGGGCDVPSPQDFDTVSISITTTQKGVSDERMAERTTKVITDALAGIYAVTDITGSTENGTSDVRLDFPTDCDVNVVFQNVLGCVEQAARRLPVGAKVKLRMYYLKIMESKGDDHPTSLLIRNVKSASFDVKKASALTGQIFSGLRRSKDMPEIKCMHDYCLCKGGPKDRYTMRFPSALEEAMEKIGMGGTIRYDYDASRTQHSLWPVVLVWVMFDSALHESAWKSTTHWLDQNENKVGWDCSLRCMVTNMQALYVLKLYPTFEGIEMSREDVREWTERFLANLPTEVGTPEVVMWLEHVRTREEMK